MAIASRDGLVRSEILENLTQDVQVSNLIGEKLFPVIGANGRKVTIPTFLKGADRRSVIDSRYEAGTYPKVITWDRDKEDYSIERRMLDGAVDEEEIKHAQFGMDPYARVARNLTIAMATYREAQYAALVQNATPDATYPAANVLALTTSGQRWNHADSNGNMDQDVLAQILPKSDAIALALGVRPNVGVCSEKTMRLLRRNTTLRSAAGIIFSGAAIGPQLEDAQVARLMGLDVIEIGDAAAFPSGATSPVNLWSDNVFAAFYRSRTPSIDDISFGYTLYDKTFGKSRISTYLDVPRGNTNFVRREETYDPIIITGQAGFVITGLLSGS